MRIRVWVLCSVLLVALVPYLHTAPIPGAPDPAAFRHWRTTLQSEPVTLGLAHGQGKWVGAGSGLRYSTNGVDWLSTGWGGDYYYKTIYSEGVFVAVGQNTWSIAASTNGIDWRGLYPWVQTPFLGVAYG